MSDATGHSEVLRAKKGDVLIFRLSKPIDVATFERFTNQAAKSFKKKGITAVFITDDVELYAAVGE